MRRWALLTLLAAIITILFSPSVPAPTYHVMYRELNNRPQVREVCSNCAYTTIASALAAITDASATNPYRIEIKPGRYDVDGAEAITMKSYVHLHGAGRGSTIIYCDVGSCQTVTVPDGVVGVHISNLTIGGAYPVQIAAGTAGSDTVVDNCQVGGWDSEDLGTNSVNGFIFGAQTGSAKATVVSQNNIIHSGQDMLVMNQNSDFTSLGDYWYGVPFTTLTTQRWFVSQGEGGLRLFVNGSIVRMAAGSSTLSTDQAFLFNASATSNNVGNRIEIVNTTIDQETNTDRNCFNFATTAANTSASRVLLQDVTCRIVKQGSAGKTCQALVVANDADFANWTIDVIGGTWTQSNCSTMRDVNNANASVTPTLTNVKHAGVYTGAGTVSYGDVRAGVFGVKATIGDGTASDARVLTFDAGTTDAAVTWNDTLNTLTLDTPEVLRLGGITTGATLGTAGDITIDTSANQLAYYSGGAARVLDPVRTACHTTRGIAATDDNFVFWMASQAVTVTSVGCFCVGTCSTLPTFTLEDNDGNAMTITGTNPTCGTGTTEATYAAVTAANGLVAGEGIAFDVTNSPVATTDWLTVCVTYTVDRQ